MFMLSILILSLSLMLMMLSFILPLNFKMNKENPSTFECGLESSPSRTTFSLRFFLVSIIFLIFDTEIIILMPLPLSLNQMKSSEIWLSIFFLCIITLSLIFEWEIKALEWND